MFLIVIFAEYFIHEKHIPKAVGRESQDGERL